MWKFWQYFFSGRTASADKSVFKTSSKEAYPIGVKSGRSSIDNNEYYFNKSTPLNPDFSLEYLPVLNYLSIFHHDISNLVQKVVDLAGTEHEISFDSSVPEKQAKEMRKYLNSQEGRLQSYSAGPYSLINNLLRQVVVYGALSAERVVKSDLSGIDKIVMVSPEEIFFFYADGEYLPHQKIKILQNDGKYTSLGNYKELNTFTYKYIPILQANQVPYAIPPLLSAMETLGIERSLLKNFDSISKKIGMFGFLEVLLTAPEQLDNESDQQYVARCIAYRNQVAPEIQNTLSEGYVVGFEGKHQFNLAGSNVNSGGAEKMLQMVDTMKMSGMKIDPNMLGRHNTVTETFGRVLLALLLANVKSYQQIIASFLSDTFKLDLLLAGYQVAKVSVEFSEPLISDEMKKEQADGAKIDNVIKKYNQGIISQLQVAQELGYEKPASEKPLQENTKPNPNETPIDNSVDNPSSKGSNSLQDSIISLGSRFRIFDYDIPTNYANGVTDWNDPVTQSFSDNYLDAVTDIYKQAVSKVGRKAIQAVKKLAPNATLANVESNILLALYANWDNAFTSLVKPNAKKNVSNIYSFYRFDKSVIPDGKQTSQNSNFKAAADFDLLDKKVIDFMSKYDTLYLGKFITDPDTKLKITNFIKEWYLKYEGQIDSEEAVKALQPLFSEVLINEDYKIRRILETTVNKLRSYGNVNYMDSAGVEKFRVVEILDQITCSHCKAMNGREFSVSTAKAKIRKIVDGSVDTVAEYSPFATTLKVEELQAKTDAELQTLGIDTTPFHPLCRGRLIAVIE